MYSWQTLYFVALMMTGKICKTWSTSGKTHNNLISALHMIDFKLSYNFVQSQLFN